MEINNKLFENEKISKAIIKLAIPLTISLFVSELYNMVDTVFVGRFIGPSAIGALTIAFPIQRLLISIGSLIAVGASTYVARMLGEKKYRNIKNAIFTSVFSTLILLFSISLLIFVFIEPILKALGASDTLYPLAKTYTVIILLGGVFQSLAVVISYIITSLGNPKITLYSNGLGAIINVIIDFVFVGILNWGVAGAAIATVISQIIAFIFVIYSYNKVKKNITDLANEMPIKNSNIKIGFKFSILFVILSVGFSSFIVEISDAIVAMFLNNILFLQGGDSAIIIIGTITKVSMFMFITIIGISSAMQPIIAYNYGGNNTKRVNETIKVGSKYLLGASFILWIILMSATKPILGFFLKDEVLLPQAILAFRICISLLPTASIYYVCIYYYQAIGRASTSFFLSLYRQILLFIPLAIILVNYLGVIGAWIAFPVSDIISAITSLFLIKKVNLSKDTSFTISDKKLIKTLS